MLLKDPETRKQYGIERRAKLKNDPVYQKKLKQRTTRLATKDKKAEYDAKRRQPLPKNYKRDVNQRYWTKLKKFNDPERLQRCYANNG